MTKRTMDIEAVLRWAYQDELPKAVLGDDRQFPDGVRSGWAGIASYAQLLTLIDYNAYGVLPDLAAVGEPHPDALRVADAVEALVSCSVAIPDGWSPLADMGDLGAEGDRVVEIAALWAQARASASALVVTRAILGGEPCWQGDVPERKVRCGANGRPMWFRKSLVMISEGDPALGIEPEYVEAVVDGFNAKRRRPYADAYQETFLDPDPQPLAISRAEYEIWHAALRLLFDSLVGTLGSIEVTPSRRSARPWEPSSARDVTARPQIFSVDSVGVVATSERKFPCVA
ncbi:MULTISPECIES: hypothetical protein [unclassified Chelatococcus]|uniref:hypothetical protein n=1 Tax=unclassified Chelatococcus TaxID=2638111 RepID=UPI001BCBBF8F|nr:MULTISPECIES: hypothetical protein [unclassified Chelatococcus]MBS7698758.1 hypothetical protein [Chelatococcus sp. YT9]MBX3554660.1 hypothetical protein [Chelatococcus sp.]